MSMFNQSRYPRRWSEMSLDFKLFFAFHLTMMALFVTGGALGAPVILAIAGGMLGVLTVVALVHRFRSGWRWRGAGPKQVLGAVGSVAAVGLMAFVIAPMASPLQPAILPWYLILGGIGLFNTLQSLRLLRASQVDFLADCGQGVTSEDAEAAVPAAPRWKRIVEAVYGVAFLLVWLDAMAFFYCLNTGLRDGAPALTPTLTEQLVDHGRVVFVSASDKARIDLLEGVMMGGIPTMVLLGLALTFVFKIPVIPVNGRWSRR